MGSLMRTMNLLLDRHPESRKRDLAFHIPTIIPVLPGVTASPPGLLPLLPLPSPSLPSSPSWKPLVHCVVAPCLSIAALAVLAAAVRWPSPAVVP